MAKTTYTTVTDVPLIRVGKWNPSEGDGTITLDQLEQIVAASTDSRLNIAVLKLGHTDERFDNPDFFDGDGQPAYGQVTNLRVTDDEGGTLIGDYINIPEDLVNVMESAYPFRSVEIHYGVQLVDEKETLLEEFPAVLTAVALLGEAQPAVSGLGAIHEAFTGKTPAGVKVRVDAKGHFALAGGHTFESLRTQLRAVLDARNTSGYLWVTDLDDSMVIYEIENEDGYTNWRESFVINQDSTVSLSGQPEQVVRRTSFEPVAQNSTFPQFKSAKTHPVIVQKPAVVVAASKSTTESKEDIVTPEQIKSLREQGLLSADVTDDAVLAALGTSEQESTDTEAEAEAEVEVPAPVAAAAAQPAVVQVSAAQFAEMQNRLNTLDGELATYRGTETERRHAQILTAAKREGRIHPKDEAAYKTMLTRDEAGTKELLAQIQPTIHTREIGSDQAGFTIGTSEAVSKAQSETDDAIFGGK